MKSLFSSLIIIVLLQTTVVKTQPGIPQTMSYQGMLTKKVGNTNVPVNTGDYLIDFTIWDNPNYSGPPLWPSHISPVWVRVTNGTFSIILGNQTPPQPITPPIDLPFNKQYWLNIQVVVATPDPNAQRTYPLIRLTTSPYSFRSVALLGPGSTATGNEATVGGVSSQGSGDFSIIGGGRGNIISDEADSSVIGGGTMNIIESASSAVGGGVTNKILSNGSAGSTISGGIKNIIDGDVIGITSGEGLNTISGGSNNTIFSTKSKGSTIGGGLDNLINGDGAISGEAYNTISGGKSNAMMRATASSIGGGESNNIDAAFGIDDIQSSTIGGGNGNRIESSYGTIGGGFANSIAEEGSGWNTIGGGYVNIISHSPYSTISGGYENNVGPEADYSSLGGGKGNLIYGQYSTIPGGQSNTASGLCSFAAGRRAKSYNDGTFVWADHTDADFSSTAADQFIIRASGGTGIMTPNPQSEFHIGQIPGELVRSYTAPGPTYNDDVTPTLEGLYMQAYVGGNDFERYSDIASVGYYNGGAGGSVLRFLTNNKNSSTVAERMRIDRNGFVGIGTSTPNSTLHITGSVAANVRTVTGNTTLTATDYIVLGEVTTGQITVTLPTAVDIKGRIYVIKPIMGGSVLINSNGGQIEQQTSWVITEDNPQTVVSDGANWWFLSKR